MNVNKTNAIRLLEQQNVDLELIEYRYSTDDLSAERIAEANGLNLAQIYKTLVVKGDKTGLVVALVAGGKQLSFKKLAKASGNKKMSLAPVKKLQQLTGYVRGGCSPIGMEVV